MTREDPSNSFSVDLFFLFYSGLVILTAIEILNTLKGKSPCLCHSLKASRQCVQGAFGESAFEELDEIFYIVQPFKHDIGLID